MPKMQAYHVDNQTRMCSDMSALQAVVTNLPRTEPEMPSNYTHREAFIWSRLCQILRDRGQLKDASQYALELLVDAIDEWYDWKDDIRNHGYTQLCISSGAGRRKGAKAGETDDTDLFERARPAVSGKHSAAGFMRAMLGEFGLTDATLGDLKSALKGRESETPKRPGAARYGLGVAK